MENKKNMLRMRTFFILIVYIFVFQEVLQRKIPPLRYFDELFALSAVAIFLIKMKRKSEYGRYYTIEKIGVFFIVIIGSISSLISQYQSLLVSLLDMFLVLKFFLSVYVGYSVFSDILFEKDAKRLIRINVCVIATVFICLSVIDYVFKIYETSERYGIRSLKLFYSHQTALVAICVFLIALYVLTTEEKAKVKYVVMYVVMCVLTLRSKAFGISIIIMLLWFYLIRRHVTKINILYVVASLVVVYLFTKNQIDYYYSADAGDDIARKVLTEYAIRIANDFFPLGAGFGTYGSFQSGEHYSKLYYLYKMNHVWGLTPNGHWFISDTFWPMIIGQFGWFGMVAYVLVLVSLFLKIQKLLRLNTYVYFSAIISLVYLLIASTSEAAFVHPLSIPLAMIIGMCIGYADKKTKLGDVFNA